jgi:hypothetical protein
MMSQLATMIKCEFLPRYIKISYAKYSRILENHGPRPVRIMNNNMGLESRENIPLIYELYGKHLIFIRSRITLILYGVMLSPIHIHSRLLICSAALEKLLTTAYKATRKFTSVPKNTQFYH